MATFFHSRPHSVRPSRNAWCSSCVHRPNDCPPCPDLREAEADDEAEAEEPLDPLRFLFLLLLLLVLPIVLVLLLVLLLLGLLVFCLLMIIVEAIVEAGDAALAPDLCSTGLFLLMDMVAVAAAVAVFF